MDVKSPGNAIYIVGNTYPELGGAHYSALLGPAILTDIDIRAYTQNAPIVRPDEGKLTMETLSTVIDDGLVRSCHDCSEGGIGVAAAEMAFAGGYGMHLNLAHIPVGEPPVLDNDVRLFSESQSRFLVEIEPQHREAFEIRMADVPIGCLGTVTEGEAFIVNGIKGERIIETSLSVLKSAWQRTLR